MMRYHYAMTADSLTINPMKKSLQPFTIGIGQYCTDSANFDANIKRAVRLGKSMKNKADLLLLPELFLSGYPIDDLLHHPDFIHQHNSALLDLTDLLHENNAPPLIMGAVHYRHQRDECFNSLFHIANGTYQHLYNKYKLPNFGVFDEKRLFTQGENYGKIFNHCGYKIGLLICEDAWSAEGFSILKHKGADIVLVPNGSPFDADKHHRDRLNLFPEFAREFAMPIIYLNRVGARDDLIFDGASFVVNETGKVILQLPSFAEAEALITIDKSQSKLTITAKLCDEENHYTHSNKRYNGDKSLERMHDIYHALMMGVKDYAHHNGFSQCVIGLSGGIDSALVASIVADAIGGENLTCLLMPSQFTAQSSIDDAINCANHLNAPHHIIPITESYQQILDALNPLLGTITGGITHENLQARTRGMLLMAHSNHHNSLLLATSNKSESACGYSTLYGDMCGGYAPIQDIYKTDIFALANWRNNHIPDASACNNHAPIPENIITKPPSAELRHGQQDSDSLPPYPILDMMLYHMIEHETPLDEIAMMLAEKDIPDGKNLALKVWKMLQNSEYKRKQATICPKISQRAFATDRRYPITSYFNKS